MQEIDKIKRQNRILSFVLALCIVVILVLAGIILIPEQNVSVDESFAISGEVVSLETPYCTLEYPAEAAKSLKCVDKNESGTYSKVFYGCVEKQEIELFEISFGTKENATLIGYIMHNDTKYPVFVRSSEIDNTLNQNSQNTIYMMQEGINNVIHSITSNENFLES